MGDLQIADQAVYQSSATKVTFAVILTWPEITNAEYEVVQRIARAGENLGACVLIVDNDGYPLWASPSTDLTKIGKIDRSTCDFVLSIHFQSPKLFDVYSYTALWNPPEFFSIFEYFKATEKLASHNNVLSCLSPIADAHAGTVFAGFGRPLARPFLNLFHSPAQPYLAPKISESSTLFYIGINWERLSGDKGRHHDLLVALDRENLISIYGPDEFQGGRPWRDFHNYVGPIPFDGKSIVERINAAGICLALSSAAHQRAGVMSNRLFEGLAAGAVIIANSHPFIKQYFDDCVYVVDENLSALELTKSIRQIILEVRNNPERANERALSGQKRLEHFSLEAGLEAIITDNLQRKKLENIHYDSVASKLTVIVEYTGVNLEVLTQMLQNVFRQIGFGGTVFVVCDEALERACLSILSQEAQKVGRFKYRILCDKFNSTRDCLTTKVSRLSTTGPLFARLLTEVETDYFMLMKAGEVWFSDHTVTLLRRLEENIGCTFAVSGCLDEFTDGKGTSRREISSLYFENLGGLINISGSFDCGRFAFRTSVRETIPVSLLSSLDGLEGAAIASWAATQGQLVQTCYGSFVRSERNIKYEVNALVSPESQITYIRDSLRGNPRWHELRQIYRSPDRAYVSEMPVSAAVEVTQPKAPFAVKLNHFHMTSEGGDGVEALIEGFSATETDRTWIDGLVGRMQISVDSLSGDRKVVLCVGGRRSKRGTNQRCTFVINGTVVLEHKEVSEKLEEIQLPIGAIDPANSKLDLQIHLSHAERVLDKKLGIVIDNRRLGLWIRSFGVFSTESNAVFDAKPPGKRLSWKETIVKKLNLG